MKIPVNQLKVAIITMQFPLPSETFCSREVLNLSLKAKSVEVFCFGKQHRLYDQLLSERKLEDIKISSLTFNTLIKSVLTSIRHFRKCLFLLKLIFSGNTIGRNEMKSILLVPRAVQIFDQLRESKFDVVHCYWSHFPTLVGCLAQKFLSDTIVSTTFIAYDLFL